MLSIRNFQSEVAKRVFKGPLGHSILFGSHMAKSILYHIEYLPLIHIDHFLRTGKFLSPEREEIDVKFLLDELMLMHSKDLEAMEDGYFGPESILFENPLEHLRNFGLVLKDGIKITLRRKFNTSKDFSKEIKESQEFDQAPEYYKRNFHFQTDGYFSTKSARLYNHQVEMLFRGASDQMRRLALPPLSRHFNLTKERPRKFIEVGCGNGVSTFPISKRFPRVQISATDLSRSYIDYARDYNTDLDNVSWSQSNGSHLEKFKDNTFDAWYSIFMFHELPREERIAVLKEAYRVLKPGAIIVVVDSIQKQDRPELSQLMDLFPQNFHEPFYRNYTNHPMEELFTTAGFSDVSKDMGLSSKVIWGLKA